jgi:regulator of ribonuclease activity A
MIDVASGRASSPWPQLWAPRFESGKMIETVCTADLCDKLQGSRGVADFIGRNFGAVAYGDGSARLVHLDDDNRILFDILGEQGDGSILIVKVDSAARPAVVGENVAQRAFQNGWGGLIIDGAVRDTRVLATIPLLILAREARPFRLRTETRGAEVDRLLFGGLQIRKGDRVVADEDGIVFPGYGELD